jgi:(4-alkanoyl-5-oxo-2,5-dihydrofuran-3-yl)methyl phosphate reductase
MYAWKMHGYLERHRRGQRTKLGDRSTSSGKWGRAEFSRACGTGDRLAASRKLHWRCPRLNVGPEIPQRDAAAATIARAEGVRRIVKLSSLDVEYGLAIGAWHEKGEAALRSAGVAFTFVRPTGFMNNLLAWAHSIKTEGIVRSSTGDGGRPFIHSEDIAAVSVTALLDEEYAGRILSITGPKTLTFGDATQIIGRAIGKTLVYQTISDEEAGERYSRVSGSPEETAAHVALWRAIRDGRLAATTDQVKQILGREPISLEQWASENAPFSALKTEVLSFASAALSIVAKLPTHSSTADRC